MSSWYCLHIRSVTQFEIFIWLSALPRGLGLTPGDHAGICKHNFTSTCLSVAGMRVAPFLPEGDETVGLPV